MGISVDKIKKLRQETLAGVLNCKEALLEAKGDIAEAKKILRKRGVKIAEKKSGEKTARGIIASYIHHNGKVGVLVEIHCQSDFVARNAEFQSFTKDIAMHIAAFDPQWISPEEIPTSVLEEEKDILTEEAKKEDRPQHILEKIVEGRLRKFYTRVCLLEQPFFKDDKKTVTDCLRELIGKVGENVKIERFVRYRLRENHDNN
ncbi:elongation factor Ts [Candidatus Aerophobetes bacterium]|uniref:Elongation factor Ts n=1 Tax=Aerophobetes bacterium TaxID=2030807 RepID=A0A523USE2_UNCAE|nr:MAG: elongation factor Ts [Candidatus Aerophobetes bacterium]